MVIVWIHGMINVEQLTVRMHLRLSILINNVPYLKMAV